MATVAETAADEQAQTTNELAISRNIETAEAAEAKNTAGNPNKPSNAGPQSQSTDHMNP